MTRITITLNQLRGMIGQRVRHEGEAWEVVEVLEDGPALVLQREGRAVLQADQYGQPGRRIPEHVVVRVLTPAGDALHDEFLALELLD